MNAPSVATTPKVRLLSLIAVAVLAADIVTKVVAVAQLEGREPVEVLGGLVHLQLIRNPGAAFSLATGYTWVLTIVAAAVVVVIVRIARRLRSTGWAVALGLVLGGAMGNLTDRIFRAPGPLQGHVVDMVSLFVPDGRVWPVFNLADSSIVSGGALLVLLAVLGHEPDGTRSGRAGTRADDRAEDQPADRSDDEPDDRSDRRFDGRSDDRPSGLTDGCPDDPVDGRSDLRARSADE